MKDIVEKLNDQLLLQSFDTPGDRQERLIRYKFVASMYATIENAIAVLSDLESDHSYIYYGALKDTLDLSDSIQEVDSIWEENIYSIIHPDDLVMRHITELRYFQFLKSIPTEERYKYHTYSVVRIRTREQKYMNIIHRTFFVQSGEKESLWLALCLYGFSFDAESHPCSFIVNSVDGKILKTDEQQQLLSIRELEILRLIDSGKSSKEISVLLSISLHTVNRHRQNIIEKLRVSNSIEAIKIAKGLRIL
ncbi:MAG: response regulator transcription factor [Bacteroidales bacterium]